MPPDKFEVAKKKIEAKYDEIERNLIEEFVKAQNQGNLLKMKTIANIMTNFKGYSQCVDAFIETSQMVCHDTNRILYKISYTEINCKDYKKLTMLIKVLKTK